MCILWNDWPYGIDKKIVHLVCWTKYGFEEDPKNGFDLTPKARKLIDEFVFTTFTKHLDPEHVRGVSRLIFLLMLTLTGDLVQELGSVEVGACSRTFPCDAL